MPPLLETALSNVAVAAVLAALAFTVGRLSRRPALRHGLWLLVLLKLVTPPVVLMPLPWPAAVDEDLTLAGDAAGAVADAPPAHHTPPAPEPPDVAPAVVEPPAAPTEPEGAAEPAPAAERTDDPKQAAVEPAAVAPAKHTSTGRGDADGVAPVPSTKGGPGVATLLAWLWLAGSAAWFAAAGCRLWCFGRLLRGLTPAPAAMQAEAAALARQLGLRQWPAVWLVPGNLSPMLWVIGRRARLLFPAGLLTRIDGEQCRALLAHELAHYLRRDHWVRWLEFAVLGAYWWCPLAWWAHRELTEAEEECCDAWVVWALPGSSRAYATALVSTLDFLSDARRAQPLAARAVGHFSVLRRRLTMIMQGTNPRMLSRFGLATVVGTGLFLLPLLPTWGPFGRPSAASAQVPLTQNQAPTDKAKVLEEIDKLSKQLKVLQEKAAADQAVLEQHKAQQIEDVERKLKDLQAKFADVQKNYAQQVKQLQDQLIKLGGKVSMPITAYQLMATPGSPPYYYYEPVTQFVPSTKLPPTSSVPQPPAVPANPYQPGTVTPYPPPHGLPPGGTGQANLEKRVKELERKVEMLMKALKAKGVGPAPTGQPGVLHPTPAASPAPAAQPNVTLPPTPATPADPAQAPDGTSPRP